jgi:hypothetical protein
LGPDLQFKSNTVTGFGRDIFLFCSNLVDFDVTKYMQFNVSSKTYNQTNALFATEYWTFAELFREPLIDYDLLSRFDLYQSDAIIITGDP